MIFLKALLRTFRGFIRQNFFVVFAALSLFLPDLQLRGLVSPKAFSEPFVAPTTWLFSFCWIFVIVFVCLFILPRKSGRIAYIITASVFIILSFSQYIYFKIFDQFFWLKSIALLGEGAEYIGFALKHIDAPVLICSLLSVIFLVLAAFFWKKPKIRSLALWLVALFPILIINTAHILMQPQVHGDSVDDWDSWRKPRVVYSQFNDVNKSFDASGLYQFTIRDFYKTFFAPDKYGKAEFLLVDEYFSRKTPPKENQYTGLFKGKNVIAVMLEGIDTWMIDEKYTPTLSYMMKNGINFENYYSPFFGTGHTFNAEFAFNTGFFTPQSAVSAVNFSSNSYPYALPRLFEEAGYTARSFHYNDSEFYNRGIMHKSFGYEKYHSFTEFGMPETVAQADSNIFKNDEIYKKIIEEKPFFSFLITYSGHVPYTFDDAKLSLAKANHPDLIDQSMDPEKNNCLILARDTDDFFRLLLTRLSEDGLLDDTAIIAFTDHYAYGFSDQQKLESYKNGEILYRVPAFIYSHGEKPLRIKKPAMTIDLLPTVLNLFGLRPDGGYIGNDILSDETPGFVYFGTSAWLDEKMYHIPQEAGPDPQNADHIAAQNARVQESFRINDIVISGDYYGKK